MHEIGEYQEISDIADSRLDPYRAIKDSTLRDRDDLFVAEGVLVIERLLQSNFEIHSLLCAAPRWERLRHLLAGRSVPTLVATNEVMAVVAGFPLHRGSMALGVRRGLPAASGLLNSARRVIIADGVTNPDNVGGLFRVAAAFGVDAILLSADSADPLYRKATRVAMGWTLHVPYARLSSGEDAIALASSVGLTTIALTPREGAESLRSWARRSEDRRIAFVVGSEGDGLPEGTLRRASVQARVPISKGVDSLSVVTAAAVAAYELWSEPPSG